jgi:hypothetical protein
MEAVKKRPDLAGCVKCINDASRRLRSLKLCAGEGWERSSRLGMEKREFHEGSNTLLQ